MANLIGRLTNVTTYDTFTTATLTTGLHDHDMVGQNRRKLIADAFTYGASMHVLSGQYVTVNVDMQTGRVQGIQSGVRAY